MSEEWVHIKVRRCLRRWRQIGASAEVLRWIREGVRVAWIPERGPPAPFHRGRSMEDADEEGRAWFAGEAARLVKCGAWRRVKESRYVSRAFLVEKKVNAGDARNWRTVVDLSFLNEFCREERFRMESLKAMTRVDTANAWMIAWDIKDGYYAVAIAEADQRYFAFQAFGETYEMRGLPMGWSASPYIFHRFSQTVTKYLRAPALATQRGRRAREEKVEDLTEAPQGVACVHYLDDMLAWEPTRRGAEQLATRVRELLSDLGLMLHEAKSTMTPTQELTHLGYLVNTREGVFGVPEKKLLKIHKMAAGLLREGATHDGLVMKKSLATFNGVVVSLKLAMPGARHRLRSLYDAVASVQGWAPGRRVRLGRQARADLRYWTTVTMEGCRRPIRRPPTTRVLNSDASTTGWGGVLDSSLEVSGYWRREHPSGDMCYLEVRAVVEIVKSFKAELLNEEVVVYVDNLAMVHAINSMTSRTPRIMAELRVLMGILESGDIRLRARHIRSEANVWADALSRRNEATGHAVTSRMFQELERRFGAHTVEWFTTSDRAHLARFFSLTRTPNATGFEPFAESWKCENGLAVPPIEELPRVAQKAIEESADVTIVTPCWPTASWFQTLSAAAETTLKYPSAGNYVCAGRHEAQSREFPWSICVFRLGKSRGTSRLSEMRL